MSNLIIEFIIFACQMFFWGIVSSIFLNFLLRRSSTRNKEIENIIARVNEIVHRVRVEEHYNNYYWYDADSDDFLAQGSSPAELVDRLKSRFPDHIFLLEEKDSMLKLSAPDWKMVKLPQVD